MLDAAGAVQGLRDGVDWHPHMGAGCPCCGFRPVDHGRRKSENVYSQKPWEGRSRVRYCRCQECGASFKAVEGE